MNAFSRRSASYVVAAIISTLIWPFICSNGVVQAANLQYDKSQIYIAKESIPSVENQALASVQRRRMGELITTCRPKPGGASVPLEGKPQPETTPR
jgi:hypothetical protein